MDYYSYNSRSSVDNERPYKLNVSSTRSGNGSFTTIQLVQPRFTLSADLKIFEELLSLMEHLILNTELRVNYACCRA
jgi:hypothetical protein